MFLFMFVLRTHLAETMVIKYKHCSELLNSRSTFPLRIDSGKNIFVLVRGNGRLMFNGSKDGNVSIIIYE